MCFSATDTEINGPILALSLTPVVDKFDPPIEITFEHFQVKE